MIKYIISFTRRPLSVAVYEIIGGKGNYKEFPDIITKQMQTYYEIVKTIANVGHDETARKFRHEGGKFYVQYKQYANMEEFDSLIYVKRLVISEVLK